MALKLAIAGASGRMGRMLLDAAADDSDVVVVAALDHAASAYIGQTIAGHTLTSDTARLGEADVLIDFTRPEGTLAHLDVCAKKGVCAVIGTTGFSASEHVKLRAFAEQLPLVFAPNMSMGVNITAKLVADAARAFGADADIEVFEAHHSKKVDAPSGTALMLGRAAADARGQVFDEVAVFARHGTTGERVPGTIGFSAMRGGDIVGDHTVFFVLNGERIEITHRSSSRGTYTTGALRAAKWLPGKPVGVYNMHDVLGLGSLGN
jgi:4-hydroxy-tetrahydrodipicolinate reductase